MTVIFLAYSMIEAALAIGGLGGDPSSEAPGPVQTHVLRRNRGVSTCLKSVGDGRSNDAYVPDVPLLIAAMSGLAQVAPNLTG